MHIKINILKVILFLQYYYNIFMENDLALSLNDIFYMNLWFNNNKHKTYLFPIYYYL